MRKTGYALSILTVLVLMTSCGEQETSNETNPEEEKPIMDENSLEYQMAEILCDCFETFNEDDPMGQMDAVGCMLEKIGDHTEIGEADEEKTKEILNEICPETATKFENWQKNMKQE